MGSATDGSRRLLILDDEAAMGATIANIARTAGFDVRAVTEATPFFELFESWGPTHIALDLVMPDVDGIEVLRRLGAANCRASVLITSGVGSRVLEAARLSAQEHGLDIAGVVSKPFTPSKLRSILLGTTPRVSGPVPAAPQLVPATLTADDLEGALSRDELNVCYQPKVRCRDRALEGFEALARWQHPSWGFVPPDRFIVAAESLGLIERFTDVIFDKALRWFAPRATTGVSLSLNVSRRSLHDIGFADRIERRCAIQGVPPSSVILEITETATLADATTSLDLLTRLRFKGFRLSIDDFGVGYSSIAQLVRMPFSELKIDKSFVINASSSNESRTIIRAIVGLARGLDLQVTAEGVEDETTLNFLTESRCDLAQGYHLSRPLQPDAEDRWLDERVPIRAAPAT